MDSQGVFCPNLICPARGQREQGNIRVQSQKGRRYRCTVCGRTFTATKGTALYWLHRPLTLFVQVVTLLAHGCPPAAIVAAFGLDERTVAAWQRRAGRHSASGSMRRWCSSRSEMLGHASVAITLDLYSHVQPNMQRQAAAAMSAALGG